MSDLPAIVADEQTVLDRVLPVLRALQEGDRRTEEGLLRRLKTDQESFAEARGDRAQREALEGAIADTEMQLRSHRAARKSRDLPIGTPYFGRLVLDEQGRRPQEVLLGKVGVLDGGLAIVDWRNAPISRLFYEYDEGEDFEEEIAGREREGVIAAKRRVDIRDSVLVEVQSGDTVLRRQPEGGFSPPRAGRARDDHRLPDIVSLITREQFAIITRADSGVVLLRGRAGSGKTTVALHRVAYLHFHDPQRFRGDRVLVVMFNKALQTYISRVLPDLGVEGVGVETFHGWAGRMLRQAGIHVPFRANIPAPVARLKRHPAIGQLLEASIDRLRANTESWLAERLPSDNSDRSVGERAVIWRRIRDRWQDHTRDLYALFDDDALCRHVLPTSVHGSLEAAREHARRCQQDRVLDWQDAALLLRIGQLKHRADPQMPCPWSRRYGHVVIDEAQDLSAVEIEVLVDAADLGRSVTIAGDPAQKILAESQFEGFEALLERLTGNVTVRLDALQVGHRSTRPIMALALRALDRQDDPILDSARPGDEVVWLEGEEEGLFARVAAEIAAFRAERPWSLVAVLAKRKNVADRWAEGLSRVAQGVRRASRDDFEFGPGIVVSNVHQVKGLEFDGVVLVDPADFGRHDRQLLHVAITRAAERLWVAAPRGPGPLA